MAAAALPRMAVARDYRGPNVITLRFGGGVRRAETIEDATTFAPYLRRTLADRGVLIPNMVISQMEGGNTSHAEGTLNILTGRYEAYRHAGSKFATDALEPAEPTLFEYFRKAFDVPSHQALLVNGEDRPQDEFLTYGANGHYGINFRSEVLSLHRFKMHKFSRMIEGGGLDEAAERAARAELAKLNAQDPRDYAPEQSAELQGFWDRWRAHYGDDGFLNPRGDRLLTALALRAMTELQPRLMMVNYQDPDYVHWGNASHYTRAISIIDEGIRQLVDFADRDPFYAGNTVFVISPDCGRDANPLMSVPFQHHFNSRSAHEIWALVMGPGIAQGRVMDRSVEQVALAPTIGAIMGFATPNAEGDILSGLSA